MAGSKRYHMTCSNGHTISAPRILKACPVCIHGSPCDGTLKEKGRKR